MHRATAWEEGEEKRKTTTRCMVVGCRLGANLFPHCQMVKRVREKGEGKKGAPLLDDDAAAADASHATYGRELGAVRAGPWPKGTKDEVLFQKLTAKQSVFSHLPSQYEPKNEVDNCKERRRRNRVSQGKLSLQHVHFRSRV